MTRIEEYALLGDTRSAALVSPYGSIDWWCLPHFDGEPICGQLLGKDDAGQLLIRPVPPMGVIERDYLPGAPVLRTTWRTPTGQLTLTEGMVSSVVGKLLPSPLMVRRVEAVGGPARVRVRFAPRQGWRGDSPRLQHADGRVIARLGGLVVAMMSDPPIRLENQESVELDVRPSEPLTIAVTATWREPLVFVSPQRAWQELGEDVARWRTWSQDLLADIPFRAAVQRTLLILRFLTYSPSGAAVGAVTTSLPEEIGGVRNWDYRFTWPRDAGIGVAAFLGLGKTAEARMFFHWLCTRVGWTVHVCPRCSLSPVGGFRTNDSSRTGLDTRKAARCGRVMGRGLNISWTGTAGSLMPCRSTPNDRDRSKGRPGARCPALSTMLRNTGPIRTPAFGKHGIPRRSTPTPSSWLGWRWTVPCASRRRIAHVKARYGGGESLAMRSPPKSETADSIPILGASQEPTEVTMSTRRCWYCRCWA